MISAERKGNIAENATHMFSDILVVGAVASKIVQWIPGSSDSDF